jgi:hypothetical protein
MGSSGSPVRDGPAVGGARRSLSVILGAAAAAALAVGPSPADADTTASVFVVQGLPDQQVTLALDGRVVAEEVQGATLAGPFELAAGEHVLDVRSASGSLVTSTVRVGPGQSTDLVVHLPVTSGGDPVVTTFENDLSAVPADKGRLVVTHTAAVPPADIVVDGQVLFANVANGESLDAVVPAGSYSVSVVPTGQTGPAVLGPLDLAVTGGSLNRVYAVGDPTSDDMRVVVHVVAVSGTGSGAPSRVDTGSGGQAVGAGAPAGGWFGTP